MLASTYPTEEDIIEFEFPITGKIISEYQKLDKNLREKVRRGTNKEKFSQRKLDKYTVTTYDGKIYIPDKLQQRVVEWYHEYLCHPGIQRTEETIRRTMTWPDLHTHVKSFCTTCRKCQVCKKVKKKYGHLPVKKKIDTEPWQRVDVDLIGPWTIKIKINNKIVKMELRALTMIDPVTRWFEIVEIKHPTSHECMEAFNNAWLCRYPRPTYIGYDNGSEFKDVFKQMCNNYGIIAKTSSEYNPQSNSTVERVHLTIGDMLRTFELENKNLAEENPFTDFLNAVAFAVRSTYHTVLDATPGQVVFGRDMLLPIKFKADWAQVVQRKRKQVERDNERENSMRVKHTYKTGDLVLMTKPGIIPKMTNPRSGPYEIIRTYTNGTVRVRRGAVASRVNIRRLTPYHARTDSGGA